MMLYKLIIYILSPQIHPPIINIMNEIILHIMVPKN